MKSYLIILLLLMGQSLFAATPEDVCRDLWSGDQTECYKIINNTYIDEGVADVCMSASFKSDKFKCIIASSNKEYSERELQHCIESRFSADVPQCMERLGRSFNPDNRCDRQLGQIGRLAEDALRNLRRDPNQAERYLNRIIRLSSGNGQRP